MKLDNALKMIFLMLALAVASGCATTTTSGSGAEPTSTGAADDTSASSESMSKDDDTYTVERGDHLWGIAAKPRIYGNPYEWPLIYRSNSSTIEDADLIYPGQELAIGRGYSEADRAAAEQHARTRGEWSIGRVEESDRAYLNQ